MFQTVRHWWGSGRGKVTVRLFVFEFVVVVAGVLTAQALANWVSARAEDRVIQEENQRVRYEIGRASQNGRMWAVAAPCLEERVNAIIRAASGDEELGAGELAAPQFTGYTVEPLPEDMRRAMGSRLGVKVVDDYAALSSVTGSIVEDYREVRRGWDRFALLDPSLGSPSPADRATVRDVAVQVRSQLRHIRLNAGYVQDLAGHLGISPLLSDADLGSVTPVSSCAEIWRTGRIWHEASH
jgi:hypothetical protein